MLEKFKDHLLINGKSWNTTYNYLLRIEQVLAKVKEEDFNTENITAYLRELQKENTASTVNGYLASIIAYSKFIKKDIELPKF